MIRYITRLFQQFRKSSSGIAAVEFALIAPVMIVMFFGSVEISNILIVDRKVTTATSAIADLVAQDINITNAEMADIMAVAAALFAPFPIDGLGITVSSVVDDGGNRRVDWIEMFQGGANSGVGATGLPNGILTTGASVIVVEVSYAHTTGVGYFLADEVNLSDYFYARPRRTPQIQRVN